MQNALSTLRFFKPLKRRNISLPELLLFFASKNWTFLHQGWDFLSPKEFSLLDLHYRPVSLAESPSKASPLVDSFYNNSFNDFLLWMQTNLHLLKSKRSWQNMERGPLIGEGFFPLKFRKSCFCSFYTKQDAARRRCRHVFCVVYCNGVTSPPNLCTDKFLAIFFHHFSFCKHYLYSYNSSSIRPALK